MIVVCQNYPHPPIPPSAYTVPGGATSVSNAATLTTALAGGSAIDIVLEDGTYDKGASTYWSNNAGHRLYGRTLYGATLKNGFSMTGASTGATYQGLFFDIDTANHTLGNEIINCWGNSGSTAQSIRIRDCKFDGHSVVNTAFYGIGAGCVEGFIGQRVVIRNLIENGMRLSPYPTNPKNTVGMLLEDFDINGVMHSTPGSAGGTGEAGLFIGNWGTFRRFKMRHLGWMGVNCIGQYDGSLMEHVDIDEIEKSSSWGTGAGHAIYMEHDTKNSTFQYMKLGMETGHIIGGFQGEYEYLPFTNGAAQHAVIRNVVIKATKYGIFLDYHSDQCTVDSVKIIGPCWAGVAANQPKNGVAHTITNIDYSEMGAGTNFIADHNQNESGCGTPTW